MDADLAFDASTITYSPDPDGNILSMADNTGTTSYGYDALNRIVAKTLPGQPTNCSATAGSVTTSGTISGTICYSYDDDSKLTAYQDGGGQVQYGYNTLDEVTTLTEPGGAQTIFGYDNNHRRTTTTYPVNVTQTVTYDASGRISNIQASSGATTLTNFGYSYINPTTSQDSGLVYSITDGVLNTTTAQSFDTLNRLLEWKVTPNAGSTAAPHDYLYHYDGNGNRTYISADGAVSNLTYNAANEWVQDVAGGKTDTISWDTAGNETGDDGFGGTSIPLAITYNAKNQTATQTGCTTTTVPAGGCGTVWSMSYTGPGQSERVSQSSSAGSASYQYSQLGIGKEQDSITDPSGTSFVRDPYGTLVAMRVGDPASYYYLFDGDGSVIKLVGSAGNVVASYLYCPTGNLAEPGSGQFEFTNPYRKYGAFYDWRYLTYWLNGLQIDANSGNARQLSPLQGGYADLNSLPYSLLRSAESVALAAGADAFGIDLALSVGAGPDATVGLDIVYDFASHEEGVFAMAGGGFGLGELGSASALVVFNLSSVADFSGPFVNFSAGAEAGAGVAITAFTTFPGTGSVYGFAFAPAGEGAVVSGTITSDVLLRETYWPGPGTL